MERFTAGVAGFRLKLGGLVSGSGFALGPEYLRRDLADGGVIIRASKPAKYSDPKSVDWITQVSDCAPR